ncbi:MAG: hypothetical protein ACD_15C00101G0005 [uncultured bacterium]|nr:MAG: hypothetical protein ACD_15C00101G0005 [uncultured bacterium]HCU70512.1 hypothetical protein [Candidatus Moranbacteria bacterium]
MKKIAEKYKEYAEKNPSGKKVIGMVLISIGFLALVTPLTPGSWLMLIGLEFLGIRFVFSKRIVEWIKTLQARG